MNRQPRVLTMEAPDNSATVEFLAGNSRRKSERRGCVVRLTVENGSLFVVVMGADDRATILADEKYELPKEDNRR